MGATAVPQSVLTIEAKGSFERNSGFLSTIVDKSWRPALARKQINGEINTIDGYDASG
jgi:hypothetical protein